MSECKHRWDLHLESDATGKYVTDRWLQCDKCGRRKEVDDDQHLAERLRESSPPSTPT